MIFNDFLKKIENNQDMNLDEMFQSPMVYELCIITPNGPCVKRKKTFLGAI